MLCLILIVGGLLIMMGQHDRSEALFYYFRLEDQVPEHHLLRLIDKHISFEFVRQQLKDSYSETGRPSIDPIRKGGVLGSVLGEPEGAKKYDIRVEAFTAQPDASRLYQLADDVARHEFSIPIARTMKLQEIQEAHRIFEQGGLSGKLLLVP
jgi:hypothetical protein